MKKRYIIFIVLLGLMVYINIILSGRNNAMPIATGPKIDGFEYISINKQGCYEYRHKATGIEFVMIPGKKIEDFYSLYPLSDVMGFPTDMIKSIVENKKQRTLSKKELMSLISNRAQNPSDKNYKMNSFLISKYEIKYKVWNKIMNYKNNRGKADKPVTSDSDEIKKFLNKVNLSLPSNLELLYVMNGKYPIINFKSGKIMWDNNYGLHASAGIVNEYSISYNPLAGKLNKTEFKSMTRTISEIENMKEYFNYLQAISNPTYPLNFTGFRCVKRLDY